LLERKPSFDDNAMPKINVRKATTKSKPKKCEQSSTRLKKIASKVLREKDFLRKQNL